MLRIPISVGLVMAAATVYAQQDGPYVFGQPGRLKSYFIKGNTVDTLHGEFFRIFIDSTVSGFSVRIKKHIYDEPCKYPMPRQLFVVSDVEGELPALRKLLINAKVIDKNYRWIFNRGHLVVCGDLFDRGNHVTEYLWFLYALEAKAKNKGGYVHVILGNHDIMNISGDFRYVQPKYFASAKLLGKQYSQLYTADTELGRWLRSKNIIEQIGAYLFLHGGIAPEITQHYGDVARINTAAKPFYDRPFRNIPDSVKILFGPASPFWYRGYFDEPKVTSQQVDSILAHFGADKIIVGHTIIADSITNHYGGKVIAVDVDYHEGKAEGLLMKKGATWRVNINGMIKTLLH